MANERQPFTSLLAGIVDNRGRTCPTAESGLPLIATNCVRNDFLYPRHEKGRFVDNNTYLYWFRGHPRSGDLLFVTKGAPGRVCMVPDPVDFCIAQDMVAIRADDKKVYPRFLLALLRSEAVQEEIDRLTVGTLIPHFKKGDFDRLLLTIPDRATQQFIGDTYFSLSAKIDLNRRMSDTLEAMARALFKSWFIDFGPVRAKTAGRDPDLPADIAALFPDSFQDSELGPIPRGWKARSLRDVLTESNERVGDAEVPEYSSTNTGLELRSDHFKKKLAASSAKNKLIRSGDLVFGLSRRILNFGLMRDDIGSVSTAYKVFAVDQHEITPDLLQQMMRERPSYFYNAISGSTREGQSVSSEGLGQLKFTQPPAGLQRTFYGAVGPLSVLTTTLVKESMTIATLRDTLLPKLFSGELRANDVKSVMEGG